MREKKERKEREREERDIDSYYSSSAVEGERRIRRYNIEHKGNLLIVTAAGSNKRIQHDVQYENDTATNAELAESSRMV